VIHGAPKAIAMINSATAATTHDLRVSTDENVGCNMNLAPRSGALDLTFALRTRG
jgi:hypothetical protein